MNLEQITQNLFTLTDTPIVLISKFDIEREFIDYNIPYQIKGIIKMNREFVKQKTVDYSVYLFTDTSELTYCSFKVLESTLIIGPFLEKKIDPRIVNALSLEFKLIQSEFLQLESFYQSLSILTEEELDFIYNIISNIMHIKFRLPEFKRIHTDSVASSTKAIRGEFLLQANEVANNFKVENQFTSIIESGDIYKAEDFNSSYILNQTSQAEGNSIENEKTRLRLFETLCNRAAIRGGIDIQFAHQIAKNFEVSINSMNSIKDGEFLSQDIIVDYTWAVKNYSLLKYSNLIRNAVLHIRRNVTVPYGLSRLATDLRISREHLSREFKKETGETVSSYIQFAKVLEAIQLLKHSNNSISDISNLLGYSNSTYFTKIFKKHMGISPKQYASRNIK